MKQAYFKYILALLLFGSNGVVASRISLSSYEIVLLRTLIGCLLLLSIFLLARRPFTFWRHKKQALFLALSGAAMGCSWMFLYEAYQHLGVGVASLAYYCGPVIVMVLSPLVFHEALTRRKMAGFLAVLCGVFLVTGGVLQGRATTWGLFCGGMSALMYAVMVMFNKKAEQITGLENSLSQLFTGFLCVALFVFCKQGLAIQLAPQDWAPVLVLGLLNTGVGCYLYFSSIDALPVQTVAICGYLEPLSAVVFSVLFLQEAMSPVQLIGAALIIGGAVLGERRSTPAPDQSAARR